MSGDDFPLFVIISPEVTPEVLLLQRAQVLRNVIENHLRRVRNQWYREFFSLLREREPLSRQAPLNEASTGGGGRLQRLRGDPKRRAQGLSRSRNKEKGRESSKKWRLKMKTDPERYAKHLEKERSRYYDRKADPERHAKHLEKQRESAKSRFIDIKADPERYAKHLAKKRESMKKWRYAKHLQMRRRTSKNGGDDYSFGDLDFLEEEDEEEDKDEEEDEDDSYIDVLYDNLYGPDPPPPPPPPLGGQLLVNEIHV